MKLDEKDVRSLVRLLGDVVALDGTHAQKKAFLMAGLCRLVDADAWVWGLSCSPEPDTPQIYVSMMKAGFSEETFTKFLVALEHPEMVKVTGRFFAEIAERKTHLTRLKQQITDEKVFAASEANKAWKAADIGPLILSVRPLDDRSASTIGIYRRYKRPLFTPREARIMHILLTEVSWLHELGWPEDRGINVPELSRRQRLTLNLLTSGLRQKQIASNMNISPHTAKGYIKDVYRFFSVSSQAELMNRFLNGNGMDQD